MCHALGELLIIYKHQFPHLKIETNKENKIHNIARREMCNF